MLKKIILFIGCTIFTAHLLMTFLYLAPTNPVSNIYHKVISTYMEPIFSQHWGLFAPAPATSSLQLLYKCNESQWMDPLTPLYRKHHAFPFTYIGKMTYIYDSLAREMFNTSLQVENRFFAANGVSQIMMPKKIIEEKAYTNLATAVHGLCKMKTQQLNSYEFQIVRTYAPDFSKRMTEKTGKKEIVFYPPVKLDPSLGGTYANH